MLGRECFGSSIDEINSQLALLNSHYTTTRYVDAALGAPKDVFDREFAEQALEKAREVFKWVQSRVSLD